MAVWYGGAFNIEVPRGIGKFRNFKESAMDFTRIDQQYNLKNEIRRIEEIGEEMMKENAVYSLAKEELVFRYLIVEYE